MIVKTIGDAVRWFWVLLGNRAFGDVQLPNIFRVAATKSA